MCVLHLCVLHASLMCLSISLHYTSTAEREAARRKAAEAAAASAGGGGAAGGGPQVSAAAGVSWRVKALQRAQQLAKEQGRGLNEVCVWVCACVADCNVEGLCCPDSWGGGIVSSRCAVVERSCMSAGLAVGDALQALLFKAVCNVVSLYTGAV